MDVPGISIHGKEMDLPPEMNKDELALYEDAIQGLERCIEVLYGQAMVAADEYMSLWIGLRRRRQAGSPGQHCNCHVPERATTWISNGRESVGLVKRTTDNPFE